jgi:HSP20 family molecular chaperone IbpA
MVSSHGAMTPQPSMHTQCHGGRISASASQRIRENRPPKPRELAAECVDVGVPHTTSIRRHESRDNMVQDTSQSPWPGLDVRQEVCRLFRELIYEPWARQGHAGTQGWHPGCTIAEIKATLVIEFDLPGVRWEDIRLEIHGRVLLIAGEYTSAARHRGHTVCHYRERHAGPFIRQLRLPYHVDRRAMGVAYIDGVFIITVPKADD